MIIKNKFKKLRLSYKISLTSAGTVLIMNILSVFFVLLPIYSLASESDQQSTINDKTLSRAEDTTGIVMVATYALVTLSLISGGYGAYQDVRAKSKK